MKKLFLFLLIGTLAISASAQRNHDYRDRDHKKHGKFNERKKLAMQRQIDKINNDYNSRISYIRNSPHLRNKEKMRKIRILEKERNLSIAKCRDNFSRKYSDGLAGRRGRH